MEDTLIFKFFEQYIYDYISCLTEDTYDNITEEQVKTIINQLLNDDEMWSEIDNSIYWYLGHLSK